MKKRRRVSASQHARTICKENPKHSKEGYAFIVRALCKAYSNRNPWERLVKLRVRKRLGRVLRGEIKP